MRENLRAGLADETFLAASGLIDASKLTEPFPSNGFSAAVKPPMPSAGYDPQERGSLQAIVKKAGL